ncbi:MULTISPECIES: DUF397 domain-containing protein [Streptomyces]|uniref:DUF397 domain-containing protein n=1 Tax=Streptomyces venezuelae TaxID=54571 RepID=A0A5P2BGU7_STRVZ|nr:MULTISPECIES: DUF397 domain-containing protein [Streptomyces]NEA02302.1 DUF397 domain-containing protein [Streptomyces sp. SID10116]MYY86566.1 DUF397 domain-containing protein [Streptomyces sp. SID335]MYZ14277.1 DUF397 domain-containing protein [Streptomyces sp. SID337]NDZ90371.1 DUF397 domain-containing protein [Streptomyces sp. SID10115]NEB48033.1 DUF397 domain-containing protein [Streptomyces sp. SID339]
MVKSDWQRSSFCGGGGNNCVEVAATASDDIALRESESPADVLTTDRAALGALIRSLRQASV